MEAMRLAAIAICIGVAALPRPASAQPANEAEPAPAETEASEPDDETTSEDDVADNLNSQQQLQQTYTLKRTINGEVVETEKRTVTYSRNDPLYETEAGLTALERLQAAFDGELLTRVEAFEEAKLDFTIADANRDGFMTASEFAVLIDSWRENATRQTDAPDEDSARQRQYDAFLAEINPGAARLKKEASARERFAFMAGASEMISREDYIREYLFDFDAMDVDKDTLLRGDELMRFRTINRGGKVEM